MSMSACLYVSVCLSACPLVQISEKPCVQTSRNFLCILTILRPRLGPPATYQPVIQRVQALADISHSALCCHSNETGASIANPPNSAQLEGIPYHFPISRSHYNTSRVWTKWNGARNRCVHFIAAEGSLRRYA